MHQSFSYSKDPQNYDTHIIIVKMSLLVKACNKLVLWELTRLTNYNQSLFGAFSWKS